ncbi:MAG: type pilus assembly protein PilC [Patescibacteria group bacterium]|nr:type pilus assembly protein PilC [Patescibacteria group bacterium]MDQ5958599.1 type pilus assembly protein PilC [Patescibacteria group bacterium]
MLSFAYTARNPATGQKVNAVVQADSERAAAKLIKEQGLAPIDITLQNKEKTGFFKKVRTKDKILFARQLSTLINAGLPLVQSLRSVQKTTSSKPMQATISEVIGDVEAGSAFSKALEKHPQVFNTIFINLVGAGEISGTLDASLERLANQQEKDAEIVGKVRGAMVYPMVVVGVMALVVGFMLVSVLPQVQVLYDGLPGAELPLLTRVLLGISGLITKYWWVLIILIVIGTIFGSKWVRTVGGKKYIDGVKMHAPAIGPLFMKMYMARFTRTGSTLVASGVPLLQMLEITGKSVNNVHIEASVKRAIVQVKGGKSLADSLEGDSNFLELVPNMLRIGEQSGSVEEMMSRTADYYEKEVDQQIKTINTIIEPALMIILGIVALIIVAAVLLPIYSLAGKDLSGSR